MLLLLIGWSATRRGPDRSTLWFGLAALALIGIGAHEAASGPWTLLALPGAIIATFALLRVAVVGPDSAFFVHMQRQRRRDRPRSAAATRAWLVFGAVLTGFAGGLRWPRLCLPARLSASISGPSRTVATPPPACCRPRSAWRSRARTVRTARRLTPSPSAGGRSRFGAVPPPEALSTRWLWA